MIIASIYFIVAYRVQLMYYKFLHFFTITSSLAYSLPLHGPQGTVTGNLSYRSDCG